MTSMKTRNFDRDGRTRFLRPTARRASKRHVPDIPFTATRTPGQPCSYLQTETEKLCRLPPRRSLTRKWAKKKQTVEKRRMMTESKEANRTMVHDSGSLNQAALAY